MVIARGDGRDQAAIEMAALEHARDLDTLVSRESAPFKIETRILFGKRVEQIVGEVSREKHDLLIVPGSLWTRHLPTWLRFDLPIRLARRSQCPVWTARSHDRDWEWRARGLNSLGAH
jgi:nucleotide-binding universal stress UspA family protein